MHDTYQALRTTCTFGQYQNFRCPWEEGNRRNQKWGCLGERTRGHIPNQPPFSAIHLQPTHAGDLTSAVDVCHNPSYQGLHTPRRRTDMFNYPVPKLMITFLAISGPTVATNSAIMPLMVLTSVSDPASQETMSCIS